MTLSAFDLAIAFAIVATMPFIIWVNYRTREGLSGYLWRENPTLQRVSLIFLTLLVVFSATELLTHYGFLSVEIEDTMAMVLGIGMFILAIAVIFLASLAVYRYARALDTPAKD